MRDEKVLVYGVVLEEDPSGVNHVFWEVRKMKRKTKEQKIEEALVLLHEAGVLQEFVGEATTKALEAAAHSFSARFSLELKKAFSCKLIAKINELKQGELFGEGQ